MPPNAKDVEECLAWAKKLKQYHPDDGGPAWSQNEEMIVTMADEILRLRNAKKTGRS